MMIMFNNNTNQQQGEMRAKKTKTKASQAKRECWFLDGDNKTKIIIEHGAVNDKTSNGS